MMMHLIYLRCKARIIVTRRSSLHQVNWQEHRWSGCFLLSDDLKQQSHGGLAGFIKMKMNGGQRRNGMRGDGDIIASNDGTIRGNMQPLIIQGAQHSHRHYVILHKDSSEV